MLRQEPRSPSDESLAESAEPERQLGLDIEAARVRNYDHRDGHSVNVSLEGLDDDTRLTERSYLAPGQSTRVSAAIESGRYRLRVRVDGVERRRADIELDESLDGTAIVELGNGVVSVTRGG